MTTTRKPAKKSPARRPQPARNRAQRLAKSTEAERKPAGVAVESTSEVSYVPDMSVFESYIGRKIAGKDYLDIFAYADKRDINVLIEGPTGSGKTHAVRAYAAYTQKSFASVSNSVGIEPSQLFGRYVPNPAYTPGGDEPQYVWVDGTVTHVVRNGGVLLLNEVNFMPSRISTVLFSLLDHRREIQLLDHQGEVIKAHPELVIFADFNPDYEGTQPMNKAFRNRFGMQIEWDYDTTVEARLVQSEALRDFAGQLRTAHASGTFETPTSTNALIEFEAIRADLGYDYAVYNFTQHFPAYEREAVTTLFRAHESNLKTSFDAIDRRNNGEVEQPQAEEPEVEEDTFDAVWGVDAADIEGEWVAEVQ